MPEHRRAVLRIIAGGEGRLVFAARNPRTVFICCAPWRGAENNRRRWPFQACEHGFLAPLSRRSGHFCIIRGFGRPSPPAMIPGTAARCEHNSRAQRPTRQLLHRCVSACKSERCSRPSWVFWPTTESRQLPLQRRQRPRAIRPAGATSSGQLHRGSTSTEHNKGSTRSLESLSSAPPRMGRRPHHERPPGSPGLCR